MSFDITNKSGTHYWLLVSYGSYEELVRRYPVFKPVFHEEADPKLFTKKESAIIRENMREFLRSKGITNLSKLPKPEMDNEDKIKSMLPRLNQWDVYAVIAALKIARTGGRIKIG